MKWLKVALIVVLVAVVLYFVISFSFFRACVSPYYGRDINTGECKVIGACSPPKGLILDDSCREILNLQVEADSLRQKISNLKFPLNYNFTFKISGGYANSGYTSSNLTGEVKDGEIISAVFFLRHYSPTEEISFLNDSCLSKPQCIHKFSNMTQDIDCCRTGYWNDSNITQNMQSSINGYWKDFNMTKNSIYYFQSNSLNCYFVEFTFRNSIWCFNNEENLVLSYILGNPDERFVIEGYSIEQSDYSNFTSYVL